MKKGGIFLGRKKFVAKIRKNPQKSRKNFGDGEYARPTMRRFDLVP